MPYKCFLLVPVDKVRLELRRYRNSNVGFPCPLMPGEHSYHTAQNPFETVTVPVPGPGVYDDLSLTAPPKEDTRWPQQCRCGFVFEDSDVWQVFEERLHCRTDSGELLTLRDAPPGALWYATWFFTQETGKFGWDWDNQVTPPLQCKTPGGSWNIDGRASNCTMKDDRTHRCWIRHGQPPEIHVDKNGFTCAAGAGSILSGNYHGFLHNGSLTD